VIFVCWRGDGDTVVTRLHDARDLIDAASWCPEPHPESDGPGAPARRQRSTDGLVKLIHQSVAPGSWQHAGGTVGSIMEWNGILVVSHTPDRQREVARVLDDLRRGPQAELKTRPQAQWR
jgi:hypothetical protein